MSTYLLLIAIHIFLIQMPYWHASNIRRTAVLALFVLAEISDTLSFLITVFAIIPDNLESTVCDTLNLNSF